MSTGNHRELSVFINCPYDKAYGQIFNAIIFATVCSGFIPRCAVETGQNAEPRMRQIVDALKNSKYSIHDLSRCRGQGDANLARLNMPLELGIAMGERFDTSKGDDWHDWLVLVPKDHPYGTFISDLAGYDPKQVDEKPEAIIPAVMSWLATRPNSIEVPPPQKVLACLGAFVEGRKRLSEEWMEHEPWPKVVQEAVRVARESGLL